MSHAKTPTLVDAGRGALAAPCRGGAIVLASVPLLVLEALLVVTWSSGFIGARLAVDHAPPFLVVFWRCVVVLALLSPFVMTTLRKTPLLVLLRHAGIGLLAMSGYLAGVVKGIAYGVPAGLAALLADLLPIGTALLAAVFLGQRPTRRTGLGLGLGLAGVVLVLSDVLGLGAAPLWAYALPVLGMLSLAVATLWQKHTPSAASMPLMANLWVQCAVSSIAFAVLAVFEGRLMPVFTMGFAISVVWTAVLASIGGYGLYWICLKRSSPTRVASVLYLSPAVTLVWAWAMFDEPLSWWVAAGTAVSAAGIWLVIASDATRRR